MQESDLRQLAADLARLRSGHGSDQRRQDLRQRLNSVNPQLKRTRNVERLRLAQIEHQIRTTDTRAHPRAFKALQAAAAQSRRRLAVLDQEILQSLADGGELTCTVPAAGQAPTHQDPDPGDVQAARAAVRGRLWLAASLLDGLPLPAEPVRRVQAAIAAKIRRLEARRKSEPPRGHRRPEATSLDRHHA